MCITAPSQEISYALISQNPDHESNAFWRAQLGLENDLNYCPISLLSSFQLNVAVCSPKVILEQFCFSFLTDIHPGGRSRSQWELWRAPAKEDKDKHRSKYYHCLVGWYHTFSLTHLFNSKQFSVVVGNKTDERDDANQISKDVDEDVGHKTKTKKDAKKPSEFRRTAELAITLFGFGTMSNTFHITRSHLIIVSIKKWVQQLQHKILIRSAFLNIRPWPCALTVVWR